MSLDIYLHGPPEDRECGECGHIRPVSNCLFDANITHNLGEMATAAGIYKYLWRPDECNIKTARDLIAPLRQGIAYLKSDPEAFKRYDSPNGWGSYVDFVPWLERYLDACEQYPDAEISVSR